MKDGPIVARKLCQTRGQHARQRDMTAVEVEVNASKTGERGRDRERQGETYFGYVSPPPL